MKYSHTATPDQSSIEDERAAEAVSKNVRFFLHMVTSTLASMGLGRKGWRR